MTQINKIKELCKELLSKDNDLALTLIAKRDFKALQELIDSVLGIIEINKGKDPPNQDVLELNESNILELAFLVQKYREQLMEEDD